MDPDPDLQPLTDADALSDPLSDPDPLPDSPPYHLHADRLADGYELRLYHRDGYPLATLSGHLDADADLDAFDLAVTRLVLSERAGELLPVRAQPDPQPDAHAHRHAHFSPNEYAAKHPAGWPSGGPYVHAHPHAHPHHDWYALGDADGHPDALQDHDH